MRDPVEHYVALHDVVFPSPKLASASNPGGQLLTHSAPARNASECNQRCLQAGNVSWALPGGSATTATCALWRFCDHPGGCGSDSLQQYNALAAGACELQSFPSLVQGASKGPFVELGENATTISGSLYGARLLVTPSREWSKGYAYVGLRRDSRHKENPLPQLSGLVPGIAVALHAHPCAVDKVRVMVQADCRACVWNRSRCVDKQCTFWEGESQAFMCRRVALGQLCPCSLFRPACLWPLRCLAPACKAAAWHHLVTWPECRITPAVPEWGLWPCGKCVR